MAHSDQHHEHTGKLTDLLKHLRPRRSTILWGTLLVNVELFMLLTYASIADARLNAFVVYPLVWINAALWVFARVRPEPAARKRRLLAGGVAGGYFLSLMALTGNFGTGTTFVETSVYTGLRVVLDRPPGMSPALHYIGTYLSVQLIPFYVAGYGALAYLVYVLVLDVSRFALGGVLGLFSCISCTFPVIVGLVGSAAGVSASGIVAATASLGLGVSTVVFLVTVCLLSWRPMVDS
jgi:hypothetical protein